MLFFVGCKEKQASKNPTFEQGNSPIVLSTHESRQNQDTIWCINDPKRFTATNNSLLFKDSLGSVYFRVKRDFSKVPNRPLSRCEKIPFIYLKGIALVNDSIGFLGDVLDVESFKKFNKTNTFFYDNNRVYVHQRYPVSYPAFAEIELNSKSTEVIDSFYIKDDSRVYYQGIRLFSADPKSFTSRTYRDSLGEKLTLIYDKDSIYHLDKPYSVDRLNNLPLLNKQRDSLLAIYFR